MLGVIADADAEIWTPIRLATLELWLDGNDPGTITSSSNLTSQWNDKSGKNRHHTQANNTYKPITGTRTINGKNALDFDGTDDHIAYAWTALPQPLTIATVIASDAAPAAAVRIYGRGTVITNLNVGQGTTTWHYAAGTGRLAGTPNTSQHTLIGIFNGATLSSMRLDGVAISTADPGTAGFNAGAAGAVGGIITPASCFNGLVGEVVVASSALSGTDLTNLESYLRTKWATP